MKLPAACRALPSVVAWALGFAKFPELYDPRYRVDTAHFNAADAEIFTRS